MGKKSKNNFSELIHSFDLKTKQDEKNKDNEIVKYAKELEFFTSDRLKLLIEEEELS